MPDEKITLKQLGVRIKDKYPAYKDMDDIELATKIIDKFPEYVDLVDPTELKKKEKPVGYGTVLRSEEPSPSPSQAQQPQSQYIDRPAEFGLKDRATIDAMNRMLWDFTKDDTPVNPLIKAVTEQTGNKTLMLKSDEDVKTDNLIAQQAAKQTIPTDKLRSDWKEIQRKWDAPDNTLDYMVQSALSSSIIPTLFGSAIALARAGATPGSEGWGEKAKAALQDVFANKAEYNKTLASYDPSKLEEVGAFAMSVLVDAPIFGGGAAIGAKTAKPIIRAAGLMENGLVQMGMGKLTAKEFSKRALTGYLGKTIQQGMSTGTALASYDFLNDMKMQLESGVDPEDIDYKESLRSAKHGLLTGLALGPVAPAFGTANRIAQAGIDRAIAKKLTAYGIKTAEIPVEAGIFTLTGSRGEPITTEDYVNNLAMIGGLKVSGALQGGFRDLAKTDPSNKIDLSPEELRTIQENYPIKSMDNLDFSPKKMEAFVKDPEVPMSAKLKVLQRYAGIRPVGLDLDVDNVQTTEKNGQASVVTRNSFGEVLDVIDRTSNEDAEGFALRIQQNADDLKLWKKSDKLSIEQRKNVMESGQYDEIPDIKTIPYPLRTQEQQQKVSQFSRAVNTEVERGQRELEQKQKEAQKKTDDVVKNVEEIKTIDANIKVMQAAEHTEKEAAKIKIAREKRAVAKKKLDDSVGKDKADQYINQELIEVSEDMKLPEAQRLPGDMVSVKTKAGVEEVMRPPEGYAVEGERGWTYKDGRWEDKEGEVAQGAQNIALYYLYEAKAKPKAAETKERFLNYNDLINKMAESSPGRIGKAKAKALGILVRGVARYKGMDPDEYVRLTFRDVVQGGEPAEGALFSVRNFEETNEKGVPVWQNKFKKKAKERTRSGEVDFSERDVDTTISMIQTIADIFKMANKAQPGILPLDATIETEGENAGKYKPSVYNNADYRKTLDIDRLCQRTKQYYNTLGEIQRKTGKLLTPEELLQLGQYMRDKGDIPGCIFCYVEAGRRKAQSFAVKFAREKDPKAATETLAKLIPERDRLLKEAGWTNEKLEEMMAKPDEFNKAASENPAVAELNQMANKYILAAKGTKTAGIGEYDQQIMNFKQDFIDELNGRAGLRMFSATDLDPTHMVQLLQAMSHMTLRNLQGHAFSKDAYAPLIFDRAGLKTNMSISASGRKDFKSDYINGMDWRLAKKLRDRSENAGTMFVAKNKEQLAWALKQDWIDMVIPHHAANWEKPTNYRDFELDDFASWQHEEWSRLKSEDAIPKKMKDGKEVNMNPGEVYGNKLNFKYHMLKSEAENAGKSYKFIEDRAVDSYLQFCKDNQIEPKFSHPEFLKTIGKKNFDSLKYEGYAKMLKDYARMDTPQKPVDIRKVDIGYAQKYIADFVKRGGREEISKVRPATVDGFIKDMREGKLQSISEHEKKMLLNDELAPQIQLLEEISGGPDISPQQAMDRINQMSREGLGKLFSEREGVKRASVEFEQDGRALIRALEATTVADMAHELGHVFRRDLDANDLSIVENWAGVKDGKWERKDEEKFAKAFEKYLAEGQLPKGVPAAMAKVFDDFKRWMLEIYKEVKNVGDIEVNPEIRKVFNRLLSLEEKIIKEETGGQENAVQERSAEAVPMGQAPRDRKKMGRGVSKPEETTLPQEASQRGGEQNAVASQIKKDAIRDREFQEEIKGIIEAEEAKKPATAGYGGRAINFLQEKGKNLRVPTFKEIFLPQGRIPKKMYIELRNMAGRIEDGLLTTKEYVKKAMGDIREAYPGKISEADIKEMNLLLGMLGKNPAAFNNIYNTIATKIPTEARGAIETLRRVLDKTQHELQMLDMFSADFKSKLQGSEGFYLTRTYRVFTDKDWTWDKIHPKLKEEAAKEMAILNPNKSADEIMGLLKSYINKKDAVQPFVKEGPGALDMDRSALKKRSEELQRSPALRALMGENVDPLLNFATSMIRLRSIIEHAKAIENIRDIGLKEGLLSPEASYAKGHTKQIQYKGSSYYGEKPQLSAFWTTPEIASAIESALNPRSGYPIGIKLYLDAVTAVKIAKTAGALPKGYVRNFLSNILQTVGNGNFNVADVYSYLKDNLKDEASRNNFRHLLTRNTIVGDNADVGDIMNHLQTFNSSIGDIYSAAESLPNKAKRQLIKPFVRAYGRMDDVWKVFRFASEMTRYQRAYEKNYLKQGLDPASAKKLAEEEAIRDVSDIMHRTSTYYSDLPRWLKSIKALPIPSTFVSFPYLTTYNYLQTLDLAYREIKDPRLAHIGIQRAIGLITATASLGLAAQYSNDKLGITRKIADNYRRFLPDFWRNDIIAMTERKANGVVKYNNLTYLDYYGAITQLPYIVSRGIATNGWDYADEAIKQAAIEWAQTFVSGDILAKRVINLAANNNEYDDHIYEDTDTLGEKWGKATVYLAEAMTPAGVQSATRIAKAKREGGEWKAMLLGEITGNQIREIDPYKAFTKFIIPKRRNNINNILEEYRKKKSSFKAIVNPTDWNRMQIELDRKEAETSLNLILRELHQDYDAYIGTGADLNALNNYLSGKGDAAKGIGLDKDIRNAIINRTNIAMDLDGSISLPGAGVVDY